MNNLHETLEEMQGRIRSNLEANQEASIAVTKDEFIKKVQVISGRNRVFLWINVVMLLIVFLGSIFLVYHFIDDLKKLAVIFSISGISIAGMIYYMTYLWRQITGIDLAIVMADKLDPGTLPAIISSLLATISKKDN